MRTARLAGRFGLLLLAGLLALGLDLPWSVGGLVFMLLALGVGVAALRSAVRAHLPALPLVVLSLGLALTAVTVAANLLLLLAWPASTALQECKDSALTDQAQRACDAQWQEAVEDLLLPGR